MAIAPQIWADQAACRGSEAAVFYPAESLERKEERLEREMTAKRICQGCPVREECLEAALTRRETYGIWGGYNEMERRALLRR
jgi:WhiB family transcriptional regulator, redox-sensing transcriptional regulator